MIQAGDVIWRRIGDEIVVIRDDGLATHVLNKTAAFIWELCESEREIEEITSSICNRFDVSPEVADSDVRELVEALTDIGIMNRVEEVPGR